MRFCASSPLSTEHSAVSPSMHATTLPFKGRCISPTTWTFPSRRFHLKTLLARRIESLENSARSICGFLRRVHSGIIWVQLSSLATPLLRTSPESTIKRYFSVSFLHSYTAAAVRPAAVRPVRPVRPKAPWTTARRLGAVHRDAAGARCISALPALPALSALSVARSAPAAWLIFFSVPFFFVFLRGPPFAHAPPLLVLSVTKVHTTIFLFLLGCLAFS